MRELHRGWSWLRWACEPQLIARCVIRVCGYEWDEFRCCIISGCVLYVVLYAPAIAWAMEAQADVHNVAKRLEPVRMHTYVKSKIMVQLLRAS